MTYHNLQIFTEGTRCMNKQFRERRSAPIDDDMPNSQ